MWYIKVADEVVTLVDRYKPTRENPHKKIVGFCMLFEMKKIHIAASYYHALFIFLVLDGDHSVLYVRRENVDVDMWLGI